MPSRHIGPTELGEVGELFTQKRIWGQQVTSQLVELHGKGPDVITEAPIHLAKCCTQTLQAWQKTLAGRTAVG